MDGHDHDEQNRPVYDDPGAAALTVDRLTRYLQGPIAPAERVCGPRRAGPDVRPASPTLNEKGRSDVLARVLRASTSGGGSAQSR